MTFVIAGSNALKFHPEMESLGRANKHAWFLGYFWRYLPLTLAIIPGKIQIAVGPVATPKYSGCQRMGISPKSFWGFLLSRQAQDRRGIPMAGGVLNPGNMLALGYSRVANSAGPAFLPGARDLRLDTFNFPLEIFRPQSNLPCFNPLALPPLLGIAATVRSRRAPQSIDWPATP